MVSKKKPRVVMMPTLWHLTPYQQKKKLKELAGEVKIMNLYDDIKNVPSIEEIRKMGKEKGHNLIVMLREKFSNKALADHWDITGYTQYRKIYPEFGIETATSNNSKTDKKEEKENTDKKKDTYLHKKGWTITLSGKYSGKEVMEKLLSLEPMLGDGNNEEEFDILLNIRQKDV